MRFFNCDILYENFNFRLYLTVIFIICAVNSSLAQCNNTAGPLTPGSASNSANPFSSYSFSNPGNVTSSDGAFAQAKATIALLGGTTNYIVATNFNFAAAGIPTTATVCGIKASIQKTGTSFSPLGILTAYVLDDQVSIVKNGTIITAVNRASGTPWTGTDAWYNYGSNTDGWGTTWTVSDVQSSNFGVAISAKFIALVGLLPTASIDNIQLTVYYDSGTVLPIELNSFYVNVSNKQAILQWNAANVTANSSFVIERSADNIFWSPLDTVADNPNVVTNGYQYADKSPLPGESFYRLRIMANDATKFISEIKMINMPAIASLKLYPNPATDYIIVSNAGANPVLRVTDLSGRICNVPCRAISSDAFKLDINGLSSGTYFIAVNAVVYSFMKK